MGKKVLSEVDPGETNTCQTRREDRQENSPLDYVHHFQVFCAVQYKVKRSEP